MREVRAPRAAVRGVLACGNVMAGRERRGGYGQVSALHAMLLHEQLLDGTHRFDEPVSKTTSNCCGGVPIEIGP